MSMSGFCLGYLHLDLSATGLASGPYPWDKDGKRKHIPSHIVHGDLQGPRATSVCDMSISCHQASMPSTMKTFCTEKEKEIGTFNNLPKALQMYIICSIANFLSLLPEATLDYR